MMDDTSGDGAVLEDSGIGMASGVRAKQPFRHFRIPRVSSSWLRWQRHSSVKGVWLSVEF